MKISLKLIATYRKLLPQGIQNGMIELQVPEGTTTEEILARFGVPLDETSVFVVNGHVPLKDQLLREGDVVTAFPAMAGG